MSGLPTVQFQEKKEKETEPSSPGSWIEVDMLPETSATGWYIHTSEVPKEKIETTDITNFSQLVPRVLYDFVSDLHCEVLWLEKEPPNQPQPESTTPLLKEKD